MIEWENFCRPTCQLSWFATRRALVKYLDDIPDEDITELNIPTGIPLVYELNEDLRPIRHYYLASDEQVAAAVNAVANQGKAK